MDHFFFANEMVLVGRGVGFGREAGEVEKDAEGIQQVKSLGQRMAWLLKKIHG
jgi:multimeric flavodoxin WrbA